MRAAARALPSGPPLTQPFPLNPTPPRSFLHSYELPLYVWSTPANVISEGEASRIAESRRKESRVAAAPLSLRVRIGPSATSREQDVPLVGLSTATTVEAFKAQLHEELLSGRFDQQADAATKTPNVWRQKGLPPARCRLMFRGRELVDGALGQHGVAEDGGGAPPIVQVFIKA